MKTEIKELFKSVPAMDTDTAETFIELMELEDAEFDAVYPSFKEWLMKTYNSMEFQQKMLSQMSLYSQLDVEEERKAIKEFVEIITEDDSLSANKKELITTMFDKVLEIFEQVAKSGRASVEVGIVKLNPDAIIPQYAHPTDAGADVCAVEETKLEPGETKIVKTGIAVAIPAGYEIQVRPRSGLSLKSGLRIANAPGTIDTEYRGEIGIIMTNTNDIPYVIDKGMKIAQLVIAPTPMIKWNEVATVEELGTTSRGADGFGSTDKAVNAG